MNALVLGTWLLYTAFLCALLTLCLLSRVPATRARGLLWWYIVGQVALHIYLLGLDTAFSSGWMHETLWSGWRRLGNRAGEFMVHALLFGACLRHAVWYQPAPVPVAQPTEQPGDQPTEGG